jgi:Tat protein translocase TatB subunit
MFDIGFSEILVIFVLALIVLGPEKLPRVASQVGRWIGRARGMARQFREQLEEEVNLEQARKSPPPVTTTPPATFPGPVSTVPAQADTASPMTYPDTYSHAHPTDSQGRPLYAAPAQTLPAQAEAIVPRQQDWVGGVSGSEKPAQHAADAAYAPSNERGT